MALQGSKINWLAGLGVAMSVIACYGTLAFVAILASLGVTIALNEAIWSGAIVAFAALAAGGLVFSFSHHRVAWPVLVGGLGAAAIAYTMFMQYARAVELSGFALLFVGVVWDWRIRQARPRN